MRYLNEFWEEKKNIRIFRWEYRKLVKHILRLFGSENISVLPAGELKALWYCGL